MVDGGLPHEDAGWRRDDTEIAAIGQSADAVEGIVAFIERRASSWTAS